MYKKCSVCRKKTLITRVKIGSKVLCKTCKTSLNKEIKQGRLYISTLPNKEGFYACEKGEVNNKLYLGKDWDKAVKQLEVFNHILPLAKTYLKQIKKEEVYGKSM